MDCCRLLQALQVLASVFLSRMPLECNARYQYRYRKPKSRHHTLATFAFLALFGFASLYLTAALGRTEPLFAGGVARRPLPCRALVTRWAGHKVDGEIEPLGSYVLVRSDVASVMTKGGLLLPKKKEKLKEGKVIAVGPGEVDKESGAIQPISVSPGNKVMYSKFGESSTLDCGGAEHTLIREDDILLSYTGAEASLNDLTPTRGKVIIKLLENKDATDDGVLLARNAAMSEPTVGEVVAVGAGEIMPHGDVLEPPVEVGDIVRFLYGDEVELNSADGRFLAVRTVDCIAKWRPA